jgi:hypothetical protein
MDTKQAPDRRLARAKPIRPWRGTIWVRAKRFSRANKNRTRTNDTIGALATPGSEALAEASVLPEIISAHTDGSAGASTSLQQPPFFRPFQFFDQSVLQRHM